MIICSISNIFDNIISIKYLFCSKNTAITAYITLKWSTLVFLHGYNEKLDVSQILPKLTEAQANLSAAVLTSTYFSHKKLKNKMYKLLQYQWTSVKSLKTEELENYMENLTKLEINNGVIILAIFFMFYLSKIGRNNLMEQLKVNTKIRLHIDHFRKDYDTLILYLSDKYDRNFYKNSYQL